MANKAVYLIPSGPKNIASLFPDVDFNTVTEYTISVINDNGDVIATTPKYVNNCCCPDDKIRIQFINALGKYDAINFFKPHVIHEDTATEYQNALNYPLEKSDTGIERFNVKSNDTYEVKVNLKESDMPWARELADSPKMLLEWTGTEGQPDSYIPIVKISGKFDLLKNVEEYRYAFIMQFKLSNEYISIRN